MRKPIFFALLCACAIAFLLGSAGQRPIPPAFGPHVGLKPEAFARTPSFKSTDKLVCTYYFYWYDAPTKAHVLDHDGTDALTTHPPTLEGFSFKNPAWHKRQLEDMIAAGIDIVLPVFWGAPSEQDSKAELHWSYLGIPPLIQAREELLKEGKNPPRIGLFYDTSTLQNNAWGFHADLRTDYGRSWFYATVRDFFSMIPPRHWALMDGKPPVFLYAAAFAKGHDQGVVEHLNREFAKDFGGKIPYLVREVSWNLKSDSVYAWGGALGAKLNGVSAVGPGYDHSAVPGREPLVADREGGKFYERNWLKVLRRPSTIVAVETWNEWHEGTDVAESKEYGRKYIELTRKHVDLFKKGFVPAPLKGSYTSSSSVAWTTSDSKGLKHVHHEDGPTQPAQRLGRQGLESLKSRFGGRFVYFAVDESFRPSSPSDYVLEVVVFDGGAGRLEVEYDGTDPNAPFGGAYTRSPDSFALKGDGQWKTFTFRLPKSLFGGSQNSGADLRLVVQAEGVLVAEATVKKL